MNDFNRQVLQPVKWSRSTRRHDLTVLTSFKAGVFAPIAMIPLLREDSAAGRFTIAVEMAETREIIVNPVRVRTRAYLIPWMAMERFKKSRDEFDRSYMKQNGIAGAPVPFFETAAAGAHGSNAIRKTLGLHAKSGDLVNTMDIESYNLLWNFLAKNRSPKIAPRTRLQTDLAPAFWRHGRFADIVAGFDSATMDGQVNLTVVNGRLAVKGIGFGSGSATVSAGQLRESGGTITGVVNRVTSNDASHPILMATTGSAPNRFPDVYADLPDNAFTISMADLNMARDAQWLANLRKQFEGHDDDWIIDMLMEGLHIPDRMLTQPMLLADRTFNVRQAKRFATADDLTDSATDGATVGNLTVRVPQLHTGGVIMVVAEALPDLIHERQQDWFLYATDTAKLPEADADFADPEKVEIVKNGMIDVDHATPNDTFGYWGKNRRYAAIAPRVGGKFQRPLGGAGFVEVRQRLWSAERANPTLGADWHLATSVNAFPFLDQASDQFEVTILGGVDIKGNTQFGPPLIEASDNYSEVMGDIDQTRIEQV